MAAKLSPARKTAHHVLHRVYRDGAFADRALQAAFTRHPLKGDDRAMATEIVYGTLRHDIYLDFVLGALTREPLRKLPKIVLTAMRMGCYELLFLRTPDHAAVSQAVHIVRRTNPRQTGVTNAVLRRIGRMRDAEELPTPEERLDGLEAVATELSHPVWLLEELSERIGAAATRAWATANNQRPPVGIRVNTAKATPEDVRAALEEHGADVEPALPELPAAMWIRGAGNITQVPGFNEGHFTVQEPAAQLVALMAQAEPGMVVLDACAAPGGKTNHLAEIVGPEGQVVAVDVHPGKANLISQAAERLGNANVDTNVGDASDSSFIGSLRRDNKPFAVAVVDAPCSGMGTLRRNPELRRRRDNEIHGLCKLQDSILDAVAEHIAPGGALVYSVCTVTHAEGIERTNAFLERHADFSIDRPIHPALQPHLTDGGWLETWTHDNDVDSFYGVRLVRKLS